MMTEFFKIELLHFLTATPYQVYGWDDVLFSHVFDLNPVSRVFDLNCDSPILTIFVLF